MALQDQQVRRPDEDDELDSPKPVQAGATEISKGTAIARRCLFKVFGTLGLAALADQIAGGKIFEAMGLGEGNDEKMEHEDEGDRELLQKIDAETEKIAAQVEAESIGLTEREKAMKVVDYVGVFLFGWGIRDLLPGGHGHLHQYHYGALLALSSIKYELSDPHEKHHLIDETAANAKAFGIISGTIVVAEGLNMDVEKAYQEVAKRNPEPKDRVAIMTMLASVLSPVATTVGSSSIIKDMSSDLCDGDKDMMAICVSHISNLSGYLMFGDPPFIAVCDKYGFEAGIKWQMETMWPLALYSMFRSTYKLNKMLVEKEGLKGVEASKKAAAESVSGIGANLPILVKMIGKSLGNFAKYYTGADLSDKFAQDQGGIEVSIGEVLWQKVQSLAKLPFSDEFDGASHEGHEGMVTGDSPEVQGGNEVLFGILKNLSDLKPNSPGANQGSLAKLKQAIEDRDYKQITDLGAEMGIENISVFSQIMRDFHHNNKVDHSVDMPPASALSRLNPWEMYKRATGVNRIKHALGHNLGDVIDVFPFQAGCVPFLTTVFKDVMSEVEKMGDFSKELSGFLLIMAFSMIADNYVACKIGLEIFPDKPQIPLIASIQGGSMTAIGNMANVAQFSLDDYPLVDSVKRIGLSAEPMMISLAWAKILDKLSGLGFPLPPKPNNMRV